MGIFKPAWMSKDQDKALRAVKKLFDDATLAHIVKNDKRVDVRMAAVENLADQAALADIAKNDEHDWVREAAAKKLTCQAVLAGIAKNDGCDNVRMAAFKNLSDQPWIAHVVKNEKGWNNHKENAMHREAAEKLTDPTVLADIAKNARDDWVRKHAIQNMSDQAVLADIAKHDKDGGIRMKAAKKLADKTLAQKVFAGVVKDEKTHDLYRGDAIECLTDPTTLTDIKNNDKNWHFRKMAEKQLMVIQPKLAEFTEIGNYEDCRNAIEVIKKMTDRATLAKIMVDTTRKYVCEWETHDTEILYQESDGYRIYGDTTSKAHVFDLRNVARERLHELYGFFGGEVG